MSYRPYQQIARRASRQIMVGKVPVGGNSPITVQTMTNTPTEDAAATIAQVRRAEVAGVDIVRISCPTPESTAALAEIVREVNVPVVADIHFHYKRAIEAAKAGAACLRINPGNIGSAERVKEVVQGGAGPRLLHPHRRQRRQPGAAPAGEVRRAEPGGAGGERALARGAPAGQRLPRVQDQREGVRRVPRRRGLHAAGRGLRPPAPHRHHRGRGQAHRHGEKRDRPRQPALGRDRRHGAGVALRRAGGGGACRLGAVEVARPPAPGRQDHLLPVLRAAGLRRDQHRGDPGGAAGAYRDADHAFASSAAW